MHNAGSPEIGYFCIRTATNIPSNNNSIIRLREYYTADIFLFLSYFFFTLIYLDLNKTEDAFSKDLLLLLLKQYELFLDSFQFACKNYKGSTKDADIAKVMGFESKDEYNEIMFLREITHTVNAFNDMADVIRLYSKKPEAATQRLANLLSGDSESV